MIQTVYNAKTGETSIIEVQDPPLNLDEIKNNKLAELNNAYSNALTTGFTTNATGTPIQIKYSQLDQLNFLKRTNAIALGTSDLSFEFGTANGIITFTTDQWKVVAKDAENFEMSIYQKLATKRNIVNNATTVDEVIAIMWE